MLLFFIRECPRDYCWDFIGCDFSFNLNSGLCSLSETEKVLSCETRRSERMSLKREIYCAVYEIQKICMHYLTICIHSSHHFRVNKRMIR